MNATLDIQQIEAANTYLDNDDRLKQFHEMGSELFEVFGADREGRINTQIRNLQQIVVSARRLSDVEDFIKNQMGKNTQSNQQWRRVGDRILKQLEELRTQSNVIAKDQPQPQLPLRLHLARGWVRAVVGAYLYAKAQKELLHGRD